MFWKSLTQVQVKPTQALPDPFAATHCLCTSLYTSSHKDTTQVVLKQCSQDLWAVYVCCGRPRPLSHFGMCINPNYASTLHLLVTNSYYAFSCALTCTVCHLSHSAVIHDCHCLLSLECGLYWLSYSCVYASRHIQIIKGLTWVIIGQVSAQVSKPRLSFHETYNLFHNALISSYATNPTSLITCWLQPAAWFTVWCVPEDAWSSVTGSPQMLVWIPLYVPKGNIWALHLGAW